MIKNNQHPSSFLSHFSSSDFVVLRGATEIIRNGDVHFPFRQSSDFLYITGLDMPDLIFSAF